MIDTTKESISLIAGPTKIEQPLFSDELGEISEYNPKDIVRTICRHPEISETGNVDDLENWKATFSHKDVTFDILLSIYEERPNVFCGFEFRGNCRIIDLVRLRQYMCHNGFESLLFHD